MFLENNLDKEKVIVLNALKEKQPCFDASGLAIAISFANGYAEMLLNQVKFELLLFQFSNLLAQISSHKFKFQFYFNNFSL